MVGARGAASRRRRRRAAVEAARRTRRGHRGRGLAPHRGAPPPHATRAPGETARPARSRGAATHPPARHAVPQGDHKVVAARHQHVVRERARALHGALGRRQALGRELVHGATLEDRGRRGRGLRGFGRTGHPVVGGRRPTNCEPCARQPPILNDRAAKLEPFDVDACALRYQHSPAVAVARLSFAAGALPPGPAASAARRAALAAVRAGTSNTAAFASLLGGASAADVLGADAAGWAAATDREHAATQARLAADAAAHRDVRESMRVRVARDNEGRKGEGGGGRGDGWRIRARPGGRVRARARSSRAAGACRPCSPSPPARTSPPASLSRSRQHVCL